MSPIKKPLTLRPRKKGRRKKYSSRFAQIDRATPVFAAPKVVIGSWLRG